MAFVLTEAIGLAAALFPRPWLALFDSDPAMIEAGARYLQVVGPFYGFFGLGLVLYFASQGAGKLLWPVVGNLAVALRQTLGIRVLIVDVKDARAAAFYAAHRFRHIDSDALTLYLPVSVR